MKQQYTKPIITLFSFENDKIMADDCYKLGYVLNTSGQRLLNNITFVATVDGKSSHAEINLPAGNEYRINPNCDGEWHTCTQRDNDGNKYYNKCEFNASCHNFLQIKNNNKWENVSITWYHLNSYNKWVVGKDD